MKNKDTRTKAELKRGLSSWVEGYKQCRKHGNIRLAVQIRDDIKAVIKRLNLNPAMVWGEDPDNPKTRGI